MSSVRRTLLVTLLAAVAAVTLSAVLLVYRLARHEVDALLDYHLRQIALSLAGRVPGPSAAAVGTPAGLDFVIQIWDEDGEKLYVSAPDRGLPETPQLGLVTVETPAGAWRVYAAELSGLVVQVAQPERVRRALAFAAVSRTLAPVALILPLLAVLVWRIVGRALAPLDRLAGTVGARTTASLEPIAETSAPEEALPLVRALNGLLARLRVALAAQRAFVADAAHELRTPLAALKLQLQLAERAPEGAARAAALAELSSGLERSAHLVAQLLTLARLDPGAGPPPAATPVALPELVRQAVADHALLAEAKRIDLGAGRVDEGAAVEGDAAALRTLLANLVDNAVRHTPAGGRVDVSAGGGAAPHVEVVDTGPGSPAAERERVFDRFVRLPGAGEGGSGLGLSIVKAIAERHGASVALSDTPGGGLTVRVSFARAARVLPPAPRPRPLPVAAG